MGKDASNTAGGKPAYPGIRVTANGNQLVAYHTEARVTDGGVYYPITPSTEGGELYQQSFAEGNLNVFGRSTTAIEAEGEHAAQGGAIAYSVCGRRVVNFTSGQGLPYASEQYYHAPGKASTMIVQVGARALTKHALNVHCGHDDINGVLDTGWIIVFAKDAQQAADQSLILRRVTETSLTPGMNVQDGFLTTHLERTFYRHESELIRTFLGAPEDIIECPTEAQRVLFGPTRRRVPKMYDLANPVLLGPVQNQEHYMQGVVARRNNFIEPILQWLVESHAEFGRLTGRHYGLLTEYKTEDADTVFISLGSAAENCEAGVDYLREHRGAKVGSIHVNVLRPFPAQAIAKALAGKRNAIVLERTDEPLASDNPLGRDIRTALNKAMVIEGHPIEAGFPAIAPADTPRLFNGIYGLGSRDFRPEHILGAYEYATSGRARSDGRKAEDGTSFFVLGVPHPYAVKSNETPSLLPEGAIAVRFHSIGGWGAITTGKNLGAIIGDFNDFLSARHTELDEFGRPKEVIHVSANPKYGSEKKGAPTSYFLVVAPERIRVNCDLRHVDVVLCCDPKAFTHCNPLDGMSEGGALIWESDETGEEAWERLPIWARTQILDKNIRIYTLSGFDIARKATDRAELQLRMQGNAFLGAFFKVSPLLKEFEISTEQFEEVVRNQYVKKFGKLGMAVVDSNMEVMNQGFSRVTEIKVGDIAAADRSTLRGLPMLPLTLPATESGAGCPTCRSHPLPAGQSARTPLTQVGTFDSEFRSDYGYDQPASPLAAMGVMAAGTGDTASKYVARRETPLFIAENCTQCMECIAVCPDTALPNCSQDVDTVLRTAVKHYVADTGDRAKLLAHVPEIEKRTRALMNDAVNSKASTPFPKLVREAMVGLNGFSETARDEFLAIVDQTPVAYNKVNAIFKGPEKKSPGSGGVFSIFVSDLCKGCAACVTACGDHNALRMVPETEQVNAEHETGTAFLDLLPDTEQKFLGFYNDEHPVDSKTATLRNHLMVRRNYDALVSGDGACAGCGEKSVLRAIASLTEAYMRPLYHAKADRFAEKATQLRASGVEELAVLAALHPEQHALFVRTVAHTIMGLGGDSDKDTDARLEAYGPLSDETIIDALATVLEQESFNHKYLQALDGRMDNGQCVMAMAAHTGCNTVYGSTPPNNPHPYPWMNSLFQDGATIGWLFGESFMVDHGRRSVVPERLADAIIDKRGASITRQVYYDYTHFSDNLMTDDEIKELPKVWIVGGDGGMGDIGYQNVSKVMLQNRPNVKAVMLDTQVYSNTGGQNSDSTPMLGGSDMNSFGAATQGKAVEKKTVAETFLAGHGSPFVSQISIANAPNFYRAILDALEYRGTAFLQCFTTCQPEHGVADDMALDQAQRVRDSRGAPEFVFNPTRGETYQEALDLRGNPHPDKDWYTTKFKSTGEKYRYTVAHWCATEARFRNHLKRLKGEDATSGLIPLENMLLRITQQDVVHRRHLDPEHRAFVPDFGVFAKVPGPDGAPQVVALSRQLVLFCVERRKAWRLLQSKGGIVNAEYNAQRALLAAVDAGTLSRAELFARGPELLEEHIAGTATVAV
ncbi:MAG: 2-oxoacid:acceptor oxidoreductase family protein [Acidobacteria bacterium]|nr:2-oxoacid:acceptor oxidoreductase family protein [Acidobacteriota bacterium]